MDPSEEQHEQQETPPESGEPEQPRAGQPVETPKPERVDDPEAPPPQQELAEPAEPGIYVYEGSETTSHPMVGQLVQGENDFSQVNDPEILQAIGELVKAGVLRKS